ncbi:hypothetical protein J3A83DRAFT_4089779 [Scleroderma citrinum]
MPAQKQKSTSAVGTAAVKETKSTGAIADPKTGQHVSSPTSGKPDKAAFDVEKARIQSEIDTLQAKLSTVREKLTQANRPDTGNDKRAALRTELDSIRGQQSNSKMSRTKIFDQLKSLQENIQKQSKTLQDARKKTPFRTVVEVDARIESLETQVESGTMKLVDEKRALQEISQLKRSRKLVEGFQSMQDAIEADRRAADELRQQLDDPASKAMSERYDAIKAELDELKKEADEVHAGRSKIMEEREALQTQLNALWDEKREYERQFREANDRYWTKVSEERARRQERARAQRAAEEAQKKLEVAQRLREEAALPAFQAQIEDCQTLIDALSGKTSTNVTLSSGASPSKAAVAGVPELELRKVEDNNDGLIVRKKKGQEEEAYFAGKQKKNKKDKTAKADSAINLPLPVLRALLSLSIPAPTSPPDVARVIEDLKTKKAWFEANQARVTAENVAKAESEIQRLTIGTRWNNNSEPTTPARAESATEEVEVVEPLIPAVSSESGSTQPSGDANEV